MADKIKIVLLGDSSVGKTCLSLKYCTDSFYKNHLTTIGVDLHNKEIDTSKGKFRLQIWDTAGQERFRSVSASYLRNTDGVLLLYDITSLKSFNNVSEWLSKVRENLKGKESIVLVGNKKDLEEDRKVSFEKGNELSNRENLKFMEISAFTGDNVEKAFLTLTEDILNSGNFEVNEDCFKLEKEKEKKKRCC